MNINRRTFFRRTGAALLAAPVVLLAAKPQVQAPESNYARQWRADRVYYLACVDLFINNTQYHFDSMPTIQPGDSIEIALDSGEPHLLVNGSPRDCTIIKTTQPRKKHV